MPEIPSQLRKQRSDIRELTDKVGAHSVNATAHGGGMSAHGNEYHSPGFLANTSPYAVNTDSRFTNPREPTAHNSSFHSVGYLLNTTPYAVNTDTRFTNAREPTAHNSSFHSVLYAPIAANGYVAPTQLGLSPTSSLFLRGDNTWQTPAGGGGGPTLAKLAVNESNNLLTWKKLTLPLNVDANKAYIFEYFLVFESFVATTGINIGMTGPASPAFISFQRQIPISLTATTVGSARAYNVGVATASVDVVNSRLMAWLGGVFYNGANAGQIQPVFCPEVNATVVQIKQGSGGILHSLG